MCLLAIKHTVRYISMYVSLVYLSIYLSICVSVDLQEGNVRMKLTIVNTEGFGDQINKEQR